MKNERVEKMVKSFISSKPAIQMTLVGFGQAGSRMVDEFAAYRNIDNQHTYNCLALNSNEGDLEGLKYIEKENRVSLGLGGLGKNPEKAMEILEADQKAKKELTDFIRKKIRPTDELVLFFAGLGGGTGTSTIIKAIEEFHEFQNIPKVKEEIEKIKENVSLEELKSNQAKYAKLAFSRAKEKFIKIGVVVTLPLRTDGPEVLRQVNKFSQKIWELAKNPTKSIAFVTFADNQHFYDEFRKLPTEMRKGIKNYRDYGNKQIAEIFHELNTATTSGGADVVMDEKDFRRIITEEMGSLVISRLETPKNNIESGKDIENMFKQTFESSSFHTPIQLTTKEDDKLFAKKIHHLGILAVLDGARDFDGGEYLDETISYLQAQAPINGTPFSGYVNAKNDFNISTYVFYKVEGLPERLEKGLVAEYEEFMEQHRKSQYEKATIKSIESKDGELDFSLDDLGLGDDLFGLGGDNKPPSEEVDKNEAEELSYDILVEALNLTEED